VPVDATSAGVTVTLPTAPADRTRVGVKKIDTSANVVTVQRGGSTDVFNKAAGSTSISLSKTNQSVMLHYASSTGVWYVVAGDLPLSTLTKTDVGLGSVDNTSDLTKFTSPSLTGTPVAPTPVPSTSTTQVATTAFAHSLIVGVQTTPLYQALQAAGNVDSSVLYVVPDDTQYLARDTFARTLTDSLGTADVGGAWSIIQGPATSFDVDTAMLHVGHPAATSDKSATLPNIDTRDQEVGYAFRGSALLTAGTVTVQALLRTTDTANTYRARVIIQNAVNLQLDAQRVNTSTVTNLTGSTITTGLTFAASTWYRLRTQVIGGSPTVTVRTKLWAEGTVEPTAWSTWTDTTASITGATDAGLYTRATSTTPTTYTVDIKDFYVLPAIL
jgi:hypothetical protein